MVQKIKLEKKCPNACGDLVVLKKPLLIFPNEDAVDLIMDLPKKEQESKRFYASIQVVCPECGFYVINELTEKEFTDLENKKEG